jgi:serine/threonine protein kinase
VKVGDFGVSKRIEAELTELRTEVGTPSYQAPEVIGCGTDKEDDYTMAVDLWSLGCVAFKILTKSVPFPDGRALKRFCRSQSTFPIGPLAEVGLSAQTLDEVKSLIVADPKFRASIAIARQSE